MVNDKSNLQYTIIIIEYYLPIFISVYGFLTSKTQTNRPVISPAR